jgi:hypothetical protein
MKDYRPGSRHGSRSWVDNEGSFWIFGGEGRDGNEHNQIDLIIIMQYSLYFGYLNDLWRYKDGNWTWISGSNTRNQNGNCGTKGVISPSNMPGSRKCLCNWIDIDGNYWIFGGDGYPASGSSGIHNIHIES